MKKSLMRVRFLGAAGEVTGSRHLLNFDDKSVLIDCGMIQGGRGEAQRNHAGFGFDPRTLDAVVRQFTQRVGVPVGGADAHVLQVAERGAPLLVVAHPDLDLVLPALHPLRLCSEEALAHLGEHVLVGEP